MTAAVWGTADTLTHVHPDRIQHTVQEQDPYSGAETLKSQQLIVKLSPPGQNRPAGAGGQDGLCQSGFKWSNWKLFISNSSDRDISTFDLKLIPVWFLYVLRPHTHTHAWTYFGGRKTFHCHCQRVLMWSQWASGQMLVLLQGTSAAGLVAVGQFICCGSRVLCLHSQQRDTCLSERQI